MIYDKVLGLLIKDGYFNQTYFKETICLISERAFKLIKFIDYQEVTEKSQEDYYKRKLDADKIFTDLLEADRYKKGVRLRDLVMDNE